MFDPSVLFEVTVPAKWVLAGEHTVLLGGDALALPCRDYRLSLAYDPVSIPIHVPAELPQGQCLPGLEVEVSAQPGGSRELIETVQLLVEKLASWQGTALQTLFEGRGGKLRIESTIPIGGGLGSSAALCVALCRWFDCLPRASELENHFHGKSSGMDTAVISSDTPVLYSTREGVRPLELRRLPKFSLHDTGLRAKTKGCIQKVKTWREGVVRVTGGDEQLTVVDQRMSSAVSLALEALRQFDKGEGRRALERLAEALRSAHSCYAEWGLLPEAALNLEKDLYAKGALAVKMTGAGGGGMLVALWPDLC